MMVTASHLPPEWNGLKLFSRALGRGLNKKEVKDVMAAATRLAEEDPERDSAERAAGPAVSGFMGPYVEKLKATITAACFEGSGVAAEDETKPLAGLKICVDPGNGAGGWFATDVLEPLGADVSSSIHLEPDGTFPNHPANPEDDAHVAATSRAVKESGADVGVMLDTDVDRCGLIDGTRAPPEPVNRNRLVALCASVALEANGDAGAGVAPAARHCLTLGGSRLF